ncbi:di-trans,poly-cis-decaprenylcistransferase [Metallumcola ferriviriculae]|uniref:Di-trans,poly-cis-decaprenylcistransferase n=1 Tax=Metallumcola ferriviriculae TaxID=3039180 RepID=A0AAU0ULK4_9FIRM|nr:di-trans,poly-cis-decaprenylcistransferase [Desulfitibacteraceae bacterium MK1]
MAKPKRFTRIPKHIGVIPDGNRRWALSKGLNKEDGYGNGIDPGVELYKQCLELGVEEMSFYGFTMDNTKRPREQTKAFQKACVDAVTALTDLDASILVVGDCDSLLFPKELKDFIQRRSFGRGLMRVNFLINYGWQWDLRALMANRKEKVPGGKNIAEVLASSDVSRIDLVIRWGGRRRLSGFLPIQTVYADFYVVDEMWPDFKEGHVYEALSWYQAQDITLGG